MNIFPRVTQSLTFFHLCHQVCLACRFERSVSGFHASAYQSWRWVDERWPLDRDSWQQISLFSTSPSFDLLWP
jgi:hypothetical protein